MHPCFLISRNNLTVKPELREYIPPTNSIHKFYNIFMKCSILCSIFRRIISTKYAVCFAIIAVFVSR